MRKKVFAILIVAVVAIFSSYNIYQSQNAVALSDLALDNVEALAVRLTAGLDILNIVFFL